MKGEFDHQVPLGSPLDHRRWIIDQRLVSPVSSVVE